MKSHISGKSVGLLDLSVDIKVKRRHYHELKKKKDSIKSIHHILCSEKPVSTRRVSRTSKYATPIKRI